MTKSKPTGHGVVDLISGHVRNAGAGGDTFPITAKVCTFVAGQKLFLTDAYATIRTLMLAGF